MKLQAEQKIKYSKKCANSDEERDRKSIKYYALRFKKCMHSHRSSRNCKFYH